MKSEFTLAFNEVVEDRQLSKDVIMEALESAMVSAYRRSVNASAAQLVEAKLDMDTGEVEIFAEKEVEKDDIGKVVGKKGKNINALRTLLTAVAAKEHHRATLQLVE